MEKWKAKNASHFPTPPTTATGNYLPFPLRYTNNLTGTNYRAGQARMYTVRTVVLEEELKVIVKSYTSAVPMVFVILDKW